MWALPASAPFLLSGRLVLYVAAASAWARRIASAFRVLPLLSGPSPCGGCVCAQPAAIGKDAWAIGQDPLLFLPFVAPPFFFPPSLSILTCTRARPHMRVILPPISDVDERKDSRGSKKKGAPARTIRAHAKKGRPERREKKRKIKRNVPRKTSRQKKTKKRTQRRGPKGAQRPQWRVNHIAMQASPSTASASCAQRRRA